MTEPGRKHISLALQGGGAHGAFTWGVLDRILEDDRLHIDGVSGTSAGAMNGAVMVSGHVAGGNVGARSALDRFWESVSVLGIMSPIHATWLDRATGNWDLDDSPASIWLDTLSRLVSPYQTNPLNVSPLGDLLAKLVDFESLRRDDGIRLFVSATSVNSGKIRVFERKELTLDKLLASAALPTVFQAVEIDGEAYWDGGYMGKPAGEIMNRLNEITFNASLMREMRAIAFVLKLLDEVPGDVPLVRGLKRMHIHMIEDEPAMESLGVASKLNTDMDFLLYLKGLGRDTAERWLQKNFDALGHRSTVDIRAKFL